MTWGFLKIGGDCPSQNAVIRVAYLSDFPEAESMPALPDVRFFAPEMLGALQVAEIGAALSMGLHELSGALGSAA